MKNHPYNTRSKSNTLKVILNKPSKIVIIEDYNYKDKNKIISRKRKNTLYSSLDKQINELKDNLDGDFNEIHREATWNDSEEILLVSILYHLLTLNSELDEFYLKDKVYPHQYIHLKNQAVQLVYKMIYTEVGKKLLRKNPELKEALSSKRKRIMTQLEEGEFQDNQDGKHLLSFLKVVKI